MEDINLEKGKFIFSNNDAENISLGAYFISNSELFRSEVNYLLNLI